MDHFDYDNILRYITRYRTEVIEQIEAFDSNERNYDKKSDLLSLVLDYTPNTKEDPNKKSNIIYLKGKEVQIPEFVYKTTSGLSLNLETKQGDDDDNNLSEKNSVDDKVKTSIIALKLDKSTKHNHVNPMEILYEISNLEPLEDDANSMSQNNNKENNVIRDSNVNEDYNDDNNNDAHYNDDNNSNSIANNDEKDELNDEIEDIYNKKRKKTGPKKGLFPLTKPSFSKLTNIVNERNKVRIYLLRTPAYIDLEVTSSDSFYHLKLSIIKAIIKENQLTLKLTVPEAYELRLVDDDDEIPNMDFPELEDKDNVIRSKHCIFAFIEKENYVPLLNPTNSLINMDTKDNMNIDIKIYFKIDQNGTFSKEISLKLETSLREVLEYLSMKRLLNYKNIELYYFTEHNEEDLDMDNAINIDACLYYLQIKEFDLYFKKFSDVPASISYSQLSKKDRQDNSDYYYNNQEKYPKVTNQKSRFVIESLNEEENKSNGNGNGNGTGKEMVFNDVTAGIYQEFEVIKVKKDKSRQERVLGVDMYNLYNSLPKNKTQHMLMNLIYRGTKKPLMKIKDIVDCGYLENCSFYINIISNETMKQLLFEVKDNNTRKAIVSKLRYLIGMKKESLLD